MGQYKSQHTGPQIDAGVDAALNPDVSVTPDSDALVTSGAVADALDNIDPTITSNTDTTLNGILVGDGGKVGTKFLDTSSLTNDADHVPASSVVKSALNTVDESIAIRVSGNKTTYARGAAIGQYVIVSGSTITGIMDGMYKAAKAIPYNTVIDSTYLTAVSGGVANDLRSAITPESLSGVTPATNVTINDFSVFRAGHIAQVKADFTVGNVGSYNPILYGLPEYTSNENVVEVVAVDVSSHVIPMYIQGTTLMTRAPVNNLTLRFFVMYFTK